MTAPQSSALPDAPQRNESEDVFVEKANAFVASLEPFRVELQEQADFVNDEVVDLDAAVTASAASASAALTSENNASSSESNASTSETNAAASELAASNSASAASTSESNAASSESASSASETTASNAALSATASELVATTKASESSASEIAAANSATLSEDAKILAQAAGDYIGEWSNLTGSVAAGVSVAHLGEYWGSLVAISDVTLAEPGTSSDWQSITELSGTAAQRDTGTDFDQVPLNTNIVYPVATVADLRLLTGISVGQKFQLDGHTNQGTGGGVLTATKLHTSEVDNNGTLFVVDGVVIERPESNTAKIEDFGGGIGGDDTAILQTVVDISGVSKVPLPESINLSATVTVPIGVDIGREGGLCDVNLSASGAFINGWALVVNTTDQVSPIVSFPNIRGSKIHNIWFRNTGNTEVRRGILAFGGVEIENIRGSYMTQMVQRPTGQFTDLFKVKRVFNEPVIGTEYQIELLGLGDCAIIEQCHFPYNSLNPGDGSVNGYKVTGGLVVDLRDNIGGNYLIENGATATVQKAHAERTQMLIDSANVTLIENYYSPKSKIPIKLLNSDSQNYRLSMRDNEFTYLEGLLDFTGHQIQTAERFDIDVENCYRRYSINGQLDKSQLSGITMVDNADSPLADWNDYSYALSKKGRISLGEEVLLNFYTEVNQDSFPGITSSLDSSNLWSGSSDTLYYTAQNITDQGRLLGRNQINAEQVETVTTGGSAVRLDIDYGGRTSLGSVLVLRGSASGVYDEEVTIPGYSLGRLYDIGGTINGYEWQARASGGAQSVNTNGVLGVEYKGKNAIVNSATVPTIGDHSVGDIYLKTTPSSGSSQGWVCVSAPSTFAEMPALI